LKHDILHCRAVGYLLSKTSKKVVLAGQYSDIAGHVGSLTAIPRKCILEMKELK
jgi:hypothetical protein